VSTLKIKYVVVNVVILAILVGVVINSFQKQVSELQAKNAELKKENSELTTKNTELNSKIDALQKENTELKNQISELTTKIDALQKENTELKNRISELEKQTGKKEVKEGILKPPYYLIQGKERVHGFYPEFYSVFFYSAKKVGLLGGYPLLEGIEKYYDQIKQSTSILVIPPTGIEEYQELEKKYPDIVPLSAEKVKEFIKKYGVPFLYFAKDSNTNKIRGLIVADSVDAHLAETLFETELVLNVPYKYENGKLVPLH